MTTTINDHYRAIERGIEKMKLGFSHLLFVRGPPGIGKSFHIERCLKASGMKFAEINGDTSEAYLYRILYRHNGEVIWFKDVVRLLRGLRSIDILKSACETVAKRRITNLNYSDKQKDLPQEFTFTGKIVFDFNSLAGLKYRTDFEALASRGDFIDLLFSYGDVCQILRGICGNTWQQEVTEFLIENYRFAGHNALNLRTQYRAFQCFRYAREIGEDWRAEVKAELENQRSPIHKLLYPTLGDGPMRTSQVKKYLIRSGIVSTVRTADRRIADWLELGDVYRVSDEERDFLISLMPVSFSSSRGTDVIGNDTSDTPEAATCGVAAGTPVRAVQKIAKASRLSYSQEVMEQ